MKRFKHILIASALLCGSIFTACEDDNDTPTFPEKTPTTYDMSGFARGADVSWLSEMESEGYKFYTADEKEQECMSLLRDLGMNAIRLRVWVNPENDTEDVKGWCNKEDLLIKAWRAHNLGYRLMIDFHYSDRWADPAQQAKPQAWENYSVEELEKAIADHTKDVLSALKEMGIDVEWVQVGNETHQGMLFPTGKTTNRDGSSNTEGIVNFAKFITSGYHAVKEVYPNAKVIVHLDQGNDANLYKRIFGYLHDNNAPWDIIGMSLYPNVMPDSGDPDNWEDMNDKCIANMKNLIATYNTPVMMCEIGVPWDYEEAEAFYTDFVTKAKQVEQCLGVFTWEPQSYGNWKDYGKGMFDDSGKPTSSFNAFKR